MNDTYDCIVLSGGGAKGAYSAGVVKALFGYRKQKKITSRLCFIGTSSGALNACIIAALGEDELLDFWKNKVNNKTILGRQTQLTKSQSWCRISTQLFGKKPFAMYPDATSCIRKLIEQAVPTPTDATNSEAKETLFSKLKNEHVIFTATNYTTGRLASFYISDLFDKFVEHDKKGASGEPRLSHCNVIKDQEHLTKCLLASSAIPIFFPPVKIGKYLYIDGGIGNNTPTREAAYFMRFLKEHNLGEPGHVYCVKLDTPQTVLPENGKLGLTDILKRTLFIDQYVHMEPIISSWENINNELKGMEDKIKDLQKWLSTTNISQKLVDDILGKVHDDICRLGGATKRRQLPITIIHPSINLGDTLDFDKKRNLKNFNLGYQDMLKQVKNNLSGTEFQNLAEIEF